RPASHLTEELKATLRRAKVREVDADVGVDHADERHIWKIEALGDHLRAEQHVDLAAADPVENLGVRPLAARRVDVHARDARARKAVGEESLHLLGAESALPQQYALAARADGSRRFRMPAIVADEPLRRAMIRQRDRAIGTRRDVAALSTLDERRI